MTLAEVATRLESTGLPVAYYQFPKEDAAPPPFICYFEYGADPFYADGRTYYASLRIQIELYTELKSPIVERQIEDAFSDVPWTKESVAIESEMLYETIYTIEV